MQRLWLIFAQTVTVALAILFVVSTLARPTTNLGIILHETRTTAAEIGRAVDEWLERHQAVAASPVVT